MVLAPDASSAGGAAGALLAASARPTIIALLPGAATKTNRSKQAVAHAHREKGLTA
jgi:hypothetical protein